MTINVIAIINWLKGKKTYALGLLAIAYGLYYKDPNAVVTGLLAMGLRAGMANEVAKLASSNQ